ncbi:MAG: hypothetical protein ACE14T_12665, partial [Syntrophales bacterium]
MNADNCRITTDDEMTMRGAGAIGINRQCRLHSSACGGESLALPARRAWDLTGYAVLSHIR